MIEAKMCTRCLLTKPISEFHLNPTGKDGRLTYCRDCKNRERDESKNCSRCGETKLLSKFYRNPDMPDGRQSHCKVCQVEAARERRAAAAAKPDNNALLRNWGVPE